MKEALEVKGEVYSFARAAMTSTRNWMVLSTEIYCIPVLETRNLKSGCWQGHVPSETCRGILPCLFLVSDSLPAIFGVPWPEAA